MVRISNGGSKAVEDAVRPGSEPARPTKPGVMARIRAMARAHVPRESAAATRAHRQAAKADAASASGPPGHAAGGPAARTPGRPDGPGGGQDSGGEGRRRAHLADYGEAARGARPGNGRNARKRPPGPGGTAPERTSPARRSNKRPGARAEGRKLAKRLAILRAAARAFRSRGFAATGMREIAREAELSLGVLYYYFASKTELLYFCQDYSLDCMLEVARHALSGYASHPAQRLRTIIDAQLRLMLDELDGAAAHLEVDALPPSLRARVIKKRDRYEQSVRRIVADGVRSRAFAPCDPKLVTRAILGALNWTARWYRPDGPEPPSVVAAAFAEYLVRGLEIHGSIE